MLAKGAAACGIIALIGTGSAQQPSELGFSTRVSAMLAAKYAERFGASTVQRIGRWKTFARERKGFSPTRVFETPDGHEAALEMVNAAINDNVTWKEDREHWGAEDYWATPAELIGSAGGDCEDYAIAKYYLLKELGVPIARLRITYVRVLNLNGQAHMVLAYYASAEAEPLILDNLVPRVRPASQRTDLDPVYSFNDDEIRLVAGGRRGKPSEIRNWIHVQTRLAMEARI